MEKHGNVAYDERDVILAGKAANRSIRIFILAAGILFLVVSLINQDKQMPLLPVIGISIGGLALIYAITYRILRKDDMVPRTENQSEGSPLTRTHTSSSEPAPRA